MSTTVNPKPKKLLENPFLGSLVVPIAIVLIGSLIIFGVTKLLSTERSYKDLVREMNSKTFGNRWIAAYELSKHISSHNIPDEDVPWLVDNLKQLYNGTKDQRTKKFIIVALSSFHNPLTTDFFHQLLKTKDGELLFHGIAAIGNMPKGNNFPWEDLFPFLSSNDAVIRQATILALGTHRARGAIPLIQKLLADKEISVRYSAALVLASFKDYSAVPLVKEILMRKASSDNKPFSRDQLVALKLNALKIIEDTDWNEFDDVIKKLLTEETNAKILSRVREVAQKLKK